MKVRYVEKEKLYPYMGAVFYKTGKIFIRKDLPQPVQKFVLEHEKFHIQDYRKQQERGWYNPIFWWEIKATAYGFFKHPSGAILALILSLKRLPRLIYSYIHTKEYNGSIRKLEKKLKW